MITLDIKDMYVNLPIKGILRTAKTLLRKTDNNPEINKQIMMLLSTIMEQNYFQYNKQCYKPLNEIAMGSPIYGFLAEIYIQVIEDTHIKHRIESKELIYYNRYVDNIFILYNQNNSIDQQISNKGELLRLLNNTTFFNVFLFIKVNLSAILLVYKFIINKDCNVRIMKFISARFYLLASLVSAPSLETLAGNVLAQNIFT